MAVCIYIPSKGNGVEYLHLRQRLFLGVSSDYNNTMKQL